MKSLEDAILCKNKHARGLMGGRELRRIADRHDTSTERVIEVLKKLKFELELTFNGRPIWRKR
jgi:hypothetical protein